MHRRDPAYAFGVFGIAKAPWRPSVEDANADALDAGYASVDEDGRCYIMVPGEIWVTHDLVPVLPRGHALDPVARAAARPLSRIERIIARREGTG